MRKNFYYILCISTLAIFLIFFLQEKTRIFKLKTLGGVTNTTEFPHITFKSYTDGSLQNNLEQYSKENFGFREWAIRLYNQYLWTIFHKESVATVLVGKNNYLFEKWFVEDYYQSRMYKYTDKPEELIKKFNEESLRLYKIQEILKEYDVHLFVAFLPGKERIYPEYLPDNKWFFNEKGPVAIEYYPKRFDELGINYINFSKWFENIKDSVDYPIFPQTGTHWSNIAATYASDSILHYMESLCNKNIPDLKIGEPYPDITRSPDDDLEKLLNLIFSIQKEQNYYADVSIIPDSTSQKINLINIGDSFFWNIHYSWPYKELFSNYVYWYYNSTIYFDNNYKSTKEINLVEQLIKTDVVMLFYCTAQLYDLGNSFAAQALVHLCYDEEQINDVLNKIMNNMKDSQEWYNDLIKKAENNGVTIEEEMLSDAKFLLYSNPENYFDELKSDDIPTIRNKELEKYCKYKSHNPQELKMNKIKEEMFNNPKWMEVLKQKAKDSGKTLEEVIEEDAIWIYNERYQTN